MEPVGVIETDYLVIGAGTAGMAFVDTLVDRTDAEVVLVDRRHAPGGHWLDAYPFVQLHQPSSFYGVGSTPLGLDRVEVEGPEAGFYERASGPEICGYFDDVLHHHLLPTEQVRFFPLCDYLGEARFRSRITGQVTEVSVRRAVVDATYMTTRVPATEPPPFEVAEGVRCIPVGGLTSLLEPPGGYDIVGGGKTALDAIGWLLARGTPPEQIRWIRPRDTWLLNRAHFQPGSGSLDTYEGAVLQLEAVARGGSVATIFDRLEGDGIMLRTDRAVEPELMRGATLSMAELEQLRRVSDVVRLGYVERIGPDEITLSRGSIPTRPDRVHVHCAAPGLADRPPIPVFGDGTVTVQPVSRVSLPLSSSVIGLVEGSDRTTEEKNALCPPNPWPQTPFDYLRALLLGMRTEAGWLGAPDLMEFVDGSRLNLLRDLPEQDPTTVGRLQERFLAALFPALEHLDVLRAEVTSAERARIPGAA